MVRAFGRGRVKGAVVAELDADGRWIEDTERGIDCDLVAVSGGTVPATSLLLQAGAKARWDEAAGAYLPDEPPPGIHAAGAVAGHGSPEAAVASGAVAGAEAALAIGLGGEDDRTRLEAERAGAERGAPASRRGGARGRVGRRARATARCFACLCEDVTADDISYAIEEGFDSLELLKRYTTVTMGPCQGRMCQLPARPQGRPGAPGRRWRMSG